MENIKEHIGMITGDIFFNLRMTVVDANFDVDVKYPDFDYAFYFLNYKNPLLFHTHIILSYMNPIEDLLNIY